MALCKMAPLHSLTYLAEEFPFLMQIGGESGWTEKQRHNSEEENNQACFIVRSPKCVFIISNMIFVIAAPLWRRI